ncbi:MAG: ABC-type branched-chain amino acid transport system, ATPase component [Solirubrobacteraceae bacterium]|nr:ABC-type branched-chain amino acid transport system, ATPase component [Solirubrobacteraceae bacterium]
MTPRRGRLRADGTRTPEDEGFEVVPSAAPADLPEPGPAAGDELLRVAGVDASYGPIQVLFGTSIVVHRGERVALLGTNGAGKSTLLRVVSGLLPVTRGTVTFKGEDVTGSSPHSLVPKGMTYIAGGRATFPSLTVLENLRMSGYPIRRKRALLQSRVEEAMDLFPRLRERAEQKVGTLSGGEQQMVALGRSLVAEPDLLIIDELSLGLAPIILREIQSMIDALAARGITMLIVEQSLNMAAAIAERSYFMEKGEIRFEGRIADLMERGDLARAVFFGGHGEPATTG